MNAPLNELPALLPGSEFAADGPDERRKVNLLGLAVAILVKAEKEGFDAVARATLLGLFEQDYEKTRKYDRSLAKLSQLKYGGFLCDINPSSWTDLMERTQNWLRFSLARRPNWGELARLIKRRLEEATHKIWQYDKDWWRAVRRVCERAYTTQEEGYDPIEEILRISDEHQRKQGQRETDAGDGCVIQESGEKSRGKGQASEETAAAMKRPKRNETANGTKLPKEPSKEAIAAYNAYYGTGKTQREVATLLAAQLKRPVDQGTVSRWVKQVREWRRAQGLPAEEDTPKAQTVSVDSQMLEMGARTDGRTTGDPRHRKRFDPDD